MIGGVLSLPRMCHKTTNRGIVSGQMLSYATGRVGQGSHGRTLVWLFCAVSWS